MLTMAEAASALLEKVTRPGVLGVPGRAVEKRATEELKAYFKRLKSAVAALKLEELTAGSADEPIVRHAVEMKVSNVLRKHRPILLAVLATNMQHAYNVALKLNYHQEAFDPGEPRDEQGRWTSGGAGVLTAHGVAGASAEEISRRGVNFVVKKNGDLTYLGKQVDANLKPGEALVAVDRKTNAWAVRDGSHDTAKLHKNKFLAAMGVDPAKAVQEADDTFDDGTLSGLLDRVGLTGQAAADYAAQHSAELVKGIDDTTMQRIADAVMQGILDQLGVPGTGRLIRSVMDDMTRARAELIASTEMNAAMSQAAIEKMSALDIPYKQIILSPDACPICVDNATEDPLPLDAAYPSGDLRPPFHPNCRCAVVGARAPETQE